jgi:hypothetical protein
MFTVHFALILLRRHGKEFCDGCQVWLDRLTNYKNVILLNSEIAEAGHHGRKPTKQFFVLATDCRVVPIHTGELPVIGSLLTPIALETQIARSHLSHFSAVCTGVDASHLIGSPRCALRRLEFRA